MDEKTIKGLIQTDEKRRKKFETKLLRGVCEDQHVWWVKILLFNNIK